MKDGNVEGVRGENEGGVALGEAETVLERGG